MTKKIYKLSFDNQSDFYIIGLVSPENDYKISWEINQSLNFNLVNIESIEIKSSKHPEYLTFPVYYYEDEKELIKYYLIGNKTNDGFLLEDYKNIDYLIKIAGDFSDDISGFVMNLKSVENIITAFQIPLQHLKQKDIQLLNF